MDEKEQPQGSQPGRNFWAWSIPAAVLIYVLSYGPYNLMSIKLSKMGYGIPEWIDLIYSFPFIIILNSKIPVLSDFLISYILMWQSMAE
jgi:hypothetical protein